MPALPPSATDMLPNTAASLLKKTPKLPTGAKPSWMKAQTATELLKCLKTVGNRVWLGEPSTAEGGFLMGWTTFDAAAAEFAGMARLTLPGDEGKAAVFFVPALAGAGLAVGVARPAHLADFAHRLHEARFLSMPCPAQGRFPLILTPSMAQLLYQSVPVAVMYPTGLPAPNISFNLGGVLQR